MSCPQVIKVVTSGPSGIGLPAGAAGDIGKYPRLRRTGGNPYDYELVTPDAVGLPQALGATASPTFAGLTVSGLPTDRLVFTGPGGTLIPISLGANLSIVNGALVAAGGGGGGGSGTATSVGLSVPTGFAVAGSPVTGAGTLALTFAVGYSLPTTASQASWDAAAGLAATAVQPGALASGLALKADLTDARFTDAREWSADTISQAEAEEGTATTRRAFTALRVFQSVAAWWAGSAAKVKLDGIQAGATANATDAQLRDRSTHTGTQAASTISDFTATARGAISVTGSLAYNSSTGVLSYTAPTPFDYDYLATLAASEIAISTTATATISRQHLISGTTADYTVTLPAASGNAGKLIGFRISNSATRVFTIKGDGSELIDGQNTRIMWAGESATLYCDGTGWQKIAGRTIPMTAVLRRAGTSQSVSALTWTAANMDTQVSGFSRMFNSANGRVAIVRPGRYACTGFAYCNATGFGNIALDLNTPSGAVGYGVAVTNGASSTNVSASFSAVFSCAANDQVLTTVYLSGGTTTINTILSPTTAVTEIPSW